MTANYREACICAVPLRKRSSSIYKQSRRHTLQENLRKHLRKHQIPASHGSRDTCPREHTVTLRSAHNAHPRCHCGLQKEYYTQVTYHFPRRHVIAVCRCPMFGEKHCDFDASSKPHNACLRVTVKHSTIGLGKWSLDVKLLLGPEIQLVHPYTVQSIAHPSTGWLRTSSRHCSDDRDGQTRSSFPDSHAPGAVCPTCPRFRDSASSRTARGVVIGQQCDNLGDGMVGGGRRKRGSVMPRPSPTFKDGLLRHALSLSL
jgi:hypothetical protein